MSYNTRSVLLNRTAQSVAASQTEQAVSEPFPIHDQDSLYLLALIKCSAMVNAAGISFKLQHAAGDGVWRNVGSSANATAVQKTWTDTDVNTGTDRITVTSHGFVTGDRVLISSANTLPTGVTAGEYWVIRIDANTIQLATSLANALAGTAVDITAAGSSTSRICQADYTVRMLATDSTDVAQLPLWSVGRWVVDSGAGDSCTVSEIRVTQRM
jgi:hypothetical protein